MALGVAPAAATDDPGPTLRVEILGTETTGLDRFIAMTGAPHGAEVAVRVTNTDAGIERDVVVRVQTSASVAMAMPVDLAPGASVTSVVAVRLSGLPGAAHEIVASAGTTTVTTRHAQVPWLLVGVAALGLHLVALGARDRLRAKVARSAAPANDQPSPSQTWARSSRYSETS